MHQPKDIQDELTINELNSQVKALGNFLKFLFRQYFLELKKHYAIMFFLLLIIAGCVIYFAVNPIKKYTGKASYTYGDFDRKAFGELIDQVNELIQTHDYVQTQKILPLSLSELKSIKSIDALNVFGKKLSEDINENERKTFYVKVTASDNMVFDSLGVAIENYLNNNSAIKEIQQIHIDEMTKEIEYNQKELLMIDSLVNAYTKNMSKAAPTVASSNTDNLNFVQLLEKGEKITRGIVDMQNYQKDSRSVRMQQPFLVSHQPVSMPLTKLILFGLIAFFLLSVLIIFFTSLFASKKYAV